MLGGGVRDGVMPKGGRRRSQAGGPGHLAGPAGVWEPGNTSSGGIQSGIVRGGRLERVDVATVRFVKHRQSTQRHLYFVTYRGTIAPMGPEMHAFQHVFPVESDPAGGWRVFGGAGGSGDPPRCSRPWVNLGGGGWPDRFFAGGWIEAAGAQVDRIELRFSNGLMLEDDAADSVALFITEESVVMSPMLVMFDRGGNVIGRDRPFPEGLNSQASACPLATWGSTVLGSCSGPRPARGGSQPVTSERPPECRACGGAAQFSVASDCRN